MITTNCEKCCFLKRDKSGNGCILNQLCVTKNNQILAPGYCRLCRSHAWAKKQNTDQPKLLLQKIIQENRLLFDLIVIFDENKNSLSQLNRTLGSDWYTENAGQVIIADVTGFGNRKNIALQYLNSREHTIKTVVDSSVENESSDQVEKTVRRISSKIKSPFFLVVPAGNIINNMCLLTKTVQYKFSRVIHWSFPFEIGSTIIIPRKLCYGLFITTPYEALIQLSEHKSFSDQIRKEEKEVGISLSWFCSGCGFA